VHSCQSSTKNSGSVWTLRCRGSWIGSWAESRWPVQLCFVCIVRWRWVMDRFMGGNQTTSFILFCLHCEMAANSLQGPVATAKKPGYPQLPGPEGKKAEQNIKTWPHKEEQLWGPTIEKKGKLKRNKTKSKSYMGDTTLLQSKNWSSSASHLNFANDLLQNDINICWWGAEGCLSNHGSKLCDQCNRCYVYLCSLETAAFLHILHIIQARM